MRRGLFWQIIYKLHLRFFDYFRGIRFYCLVNLCGGRCEGIPKIGRGLTLKYPPHSGYEIGKSCDLGPYCYIDIPLGAQLKLGNGVKLTANVVISAARKVVLGSDCLVAEFVSIRDSQHVYEAREKIRNQGLQIGEIDVGADVWIGRNATVLADSAIGDGCVIGANSIIKNQTLAPNGVYVGTPARLIKEREGKI